VAEACVSARLNVLISGGTGSGKTTLLNILSAYISGRERIVTIEDSAELQLQQPHVVRLETRPPNIEGEGEVTQYDLLVNSLRMRPDRIILGEIRGREALDMLQAMNTGHDGSMSTIHANTPRDAITRLETMVAMGGYELPQAAVRQQISSALDVIVQTQRLSDGSRKIIYFTEVLGMEGEIVTMQDIFRFDRQGLDPEGQVKGQHVATGVQPRFMERLRGSGHELRPDIFMPQ
jgi:pilus assembly protein CpaF